MGILAITLSINPRPLSALELTLSGLIMGSRVDTAGDNQNPHVIISKYPRGDCTALGPIHVYKKVRGLGDHFSGYIILERPSEISGCLHI